MPKSGKRKTVLLLKMWLKICSIVIVAILLATSVLVIGREEKECCLCNSFRYHAPCLIDLETGDLIELDIYFPHETLVAELADPQPEQGTFSFVKLGEASGYRDTAQERIEIEIPIDKTSTPALCKECRKKLSASNMDRYVLADLYAKLDERENHKLIPITDGMSLHLRCYSITANKQQDGVLKLIIQGDLD